MQYAVIATGGKQYIARPGQSLIIESLPQAVDETVTFDKVLLVVNDTDVTIGQPLVDGMTVSATVTEQRRGEKIKVFKYMPKSRYSRTMGHRQAETVVRIDTIGQAKAAKKAAPAKAAAKKEAIAE